jgi:plasmid stabilization system protein ParE
VKKVQVIWSTGALVDLEVIYDFLAEKSATAAQRITEGILNRIRQIETFPESGARQETIRTTGKIYRYLVERDYKIIYSHQDEAQVAYIETIFDTRQNPNDLKV